MSWELCQTIKNIGVMIFRASKTSRECCICTGCPGKWNTCQHSRAQKAHPGSGQRWTRAFSLGQNLLLVTLCGCDSTMSSTVPSAALCTTCGSPPAVAGVSAQPGCDTSFGSILVLLSVALAVAASVENLQRAVRKCV